MFTTFTHSCALLLLSFSLLLLRFLIGLRRTSLWKASSRYASRRTECNLHSRSWFEWDSALHWLEGNSNTLYSNWSLTDVLNIRFLKHFSYFPLTKISEREGGGRSKDQVWMHSWSTFPNSMRLSSILTRWMR